MVQGGGKSLEDLRELRNEDGLMRVTVKMRYLRPIMIRENEMP